MGPHSPAPENTGPEESGPENTAPSATFEPLRKRLAGRVLLPGDPDCAAVAMPWNVAWQPRPAAVVEAASAQDVAEAVLFAGSAGLPVAVQATGHGIASDMDGALLISTGRLDECTVHPEGWARTGAGVCWSAVLEAAAPHGLAPLCGSAPGVGVAGYTTGGGLGPLARTFGAASDRVRAFEVVTGDGRVRRATAESEPDLFWGLRGGKGSLGIVTAIEFDLLDLPVVYAGALYFGAEDTAAVAHAWAQWCGGLPPEATTSLALLHLPAMPGVPEPLTNRSTLAVRFVFAGEPEDGERLLAPLRGLAAPLVDAVGTIPYAQIGMVHADPEDPVPAVERSALLRELPEEAVDALLEAVGPGSPAAGMPGRGGALMAEVRQLGGAFAAGTGGALCHRDAGFNLFVVGIAPPPDLAGVDRLAGSIQAGLEPWATGGLLPNFANFAGPTGFAQAYDAATRARLTDLAQAYDPHRVFRIGQVPPRG